MWTYLPSFIIIDKKNNLEELPWLVITLLAAHVLLPAVHVTENAVNALPTIKETAKFPAVCFQKPLSGQAIEQSRIFIMTQKR